MLNHKTLVAISRATKDLVAIISDSAAESIFQKHGVIASGVSFVDDMQKMKLIANEIQAKSDASWFPGGSVSNTLYALGSCQPISSNIKLAWTGPTDYTDFAGSVSPVDFLRQVLVMPYSIYEPGYNRITICCISSETKDVIGVLVYSKTIPIQPNLDWPGADIIVTTINEAVIANEELFAYLSGAPSIALVVADHPSLDAPGRSRLEDLARKGSLKWLFGRFEDYIRLNIVVDGVVVPPFNHVELIGTQGKDSVIVWEVQTESFLDLPVHFIEEITGNTLGAGDAYAGGYLDARLQNESISFAHNQGYRCALEVFKSTGAHIPPRQDLNELFAATIDRQSSSHVEGEIFEKVRLAPGLVVVSCGQTGVDQAALQVASDLGLASYAIMPFGRRTENSENNRVEKDFFGDSYVIELGSSSYRYCTWANVYFSDGTLIWNYANSEGSLETIRACEIMNRPYLDLTNIPLNQTLSQVLNWSTLHNVRVLNIAGNRKSLLSESQISEVRCAIDLVLRGLARRRAEIASPIQLRPLVVSTDQKAPPLKHSLRIGFPNSRDSRMLAGRYLFDRYKLKPIPSRKLFAVYKDLGLDIYYFRARDLPRMLSSGDLDLIFCGSDLLEEEGLEVDILMDTGLQPCSVALVCDNSTTMETLNVASQYPKLAARVLSSYRDGTVSIRTINGTAEAWIKAGVANSSIDTWRTGFTCEINQLRLMRVFFSTALVVACKNYEGSEAMNNITRFVRDFDTWLNEPSEALLNGLV